jgi:NitT/TauT family transport system ATP-binding protein
LASIHALKSIARSPTDPARAGRVGKLAIRGLSKSFNGTLVYENFSLELPLGSSISIFGPNGCGKSTLINMISGLAPMDAGDALYDGRTTRETRISYVFQNYREALFPWRRAIDNIEYPLKLMGVPKAERRRRIEELVAEFDMKFDLSAYPYTLSGGQQQTISILRALVTDPEVLYLDEPFSALDYEMTLLMRAQLQKIYVKRSITMLLVSHDLEEAIELADKLVLLTRRPTRVAEIVDVDLPWPRDAAATTSEAFIALKRRCLETFWREVKAAPEPN